MRTQESLKVLPLAALVVSLAVTTVVALCRTGRTGYQYWDEVRETCRNCSTCTKPGYIVVRPCQVYQDTVCGPLHALNIDWSWLGHRLRNSSHHKKHGHKGDQWSSVTFSNNSHVNHRYFKQWHRINGNKSYHHHHNHHHNQFHHHHHHHKMLRPPESAAQLKSMESDANTVLSSPLPRLALATPASLQQPPVFTTPEALVWDWQAVVLALAVFACVVFFGAAAGYGVHQVRHDACRTADVEDLSAALGLIMPGVGNDLADSGSPAVDACNTNQCLYMEKLLVCKQPDGRGNVYIDRDNTGSPRM